MERHQDSLNRLGAQLESWREPYSTQLRHLSRRRSGPRPVNWFSTWVSLAYAKLLGSIIPDSRLKRISLEREASQACRRAQQPNLRRSAFGTGEQRGQVRHRDRVYPRRQDKNSDGKSAVLQFGYPDSRVRRVEVRNASDHPADAHPCWRGAHRRPQRDRLIGPALPGELLEDPFSGCLFLFRTRSLASIRALIFDGQGFWMAQKRLSKGRFRFWPTGDGGCALEAHQVQMLLAGGDPSAPGAPVWRSVTPVLASTMTAATYHRSTTRPVG